MLRCAFALSISVLVLVSLSGCTGDDGFPPRVPVEVEVTHNGAPVAGAHLTFAPAGDGQPAFGTTGENGKTLLSTFGQSDGALPGVYQVGVRKTAIANGTRSGDPDDEMAIPMDRSATRPTEFKELLPARYASPSRSELEATVAEGEGKNTFRFDLTD
jgi:hypothetical protein